MSLSPAVPDARVTPDAVREAASLIVASPPFSRSPQLKRFLTFLVQETLAGRDTRLKEYVIGVEVFDRPDCYDPRVDALVRVEARRLRQALESYYAADGRHAPLVVELPRGGYRLSFRLNGVSTRRWPARVGLWLLLLAAFTWLALERSSSRPWRHLEQKDSIVLAGFSNTTGESVFDETLRQGLATNLEQSPFLNIVSDRRIAQVLGLMGSPVLPVEREAARALCIRAGAATVVVGGISRLGSAYVVGLTATDCRGDAAVVHVQEQARSREGVLRALGAAAGRLRQRLGESLTSVRDFGVQVEDATTTSLEALQAFSLGKKLAREKGSPADIPFYARAIELDPDFALAHAALGVSFVNQGRQAEGERALERAYELSSGRVSERERYRIAAYYHQVVTGDWEQARAAYELWTQSYPREFAAHLNLGLGHLWLGEYDRALRDTRSAVQLEPNNVLAYTNLAALLLKTGRTDEAASILDEAARRQLTSTFLRLNRCYIAFLRGDVEMPRHQLAEVGESSVDRAALLALDSHSEVYRGRVSSGRLSGRHAAEAAAAAGASETEASILLAIALWEAELGNASRSRDLVREALSRSRGRDVLVLSALASARSDDRPTAQRLADSLAAAYPRNSVLRHYWLPTIAAARELSAGRAQAAIDQLRVVVPFELGSPPPLGLATLYPVYLRGEALLRAHRAVEAAEEFRRILERPGLVLNFVLHPLARLELARARRDAGDLPGAKRAYDEFLAGWKDGDPDLPLLRAAAAERRRLN